MNAGATTIDIGSRAERAAVRYLIAHGYAIIERNYRRKHCEIDIVARDGELLLFVEVKYRATDEWGSGLDYITPRKLHRMRRAAVTWVEDNHWQGPFDIAAVEVGGSEFEVLNFIDSVS